MAGALVAQVSGGVTAIMAKTASPTGRRVMLRTDRGGRWVWWVGLQVVDLIPKGKRIPVATIPLHDNENTETGVYRAIALHYANWRVSARRYGWWSERPDCGQGVSQ